MSVLPLVSLTYVCMYAYVYTHSSVNMSISKDSRWSVLQDQRDVSRTRSSVVMPVLAGQGLELPPGIQPSCKQEAESGPQLRHCESGNCSPAVLPPSSNCCCYEVSGTFSKAACLGCVVKLTANNGERGWLQLHQGIHRSSPSGWVKQAHQPLSNKNLTVCSEEACHVRWLNNYVGRPRVTAPSGYVPCFAWWLMHHLG